MLPTLTAHAAVNPVRNEEFMRQVSVLIAPVTVAGRLKNTQELEGALEAFRPLGRETVVFTLGAEGWVFSGPEGRGRGRAFAVTVRDTTGAGDAFHGAFASAVASGWDIERQGGVFAGGFEPPELGTQLGNQMLEQGADIIFHKTHA